MHEAATHFGNTGLHPYDSVAFSGTPKADVLTRETDSIHVLRHHGVAAKGMITAASHKESWDTLSVTMSGSGVVEGSVCGTPLRKALHRGQVSFVPAGVDQVLSFPAWHSVLVLYFPKDMLRGLTARPDGGDFAPRHSLHDQRLADLVTMLANEMSVPGEASRLMTEGLVRAIATLVARQNGEGGGPVRKIVLTNARLRRVLDYIDAHIGDDICLEDLARTADLSPFHFSRVFKMTTGETPYHYLHARRLDRARELLTGGAMPLAELALSCGFANQSHFTAAFTKANGISPGRFRRLMNE